MNNMSRVVHTLCLVVAPFAASRPVMAAAGTETDPLSWPPITAECRPWAYNWWLGSAVDTNNLARELARYREGGLGGIHIIPIYGAKGAEERYLDYLSPAWMGAMGFAVEEGRRLGMGVDMTTGTGWCFGGPNVSKEQGCWRAQAKTVEAAANQRVSEKVDSGALQGAVAVTADGQRMDLKPFVSEKGILNWTNGPQKAHVHILTAAPGGPAVKRAAPGGAGPMLNPFDAAAMSHYLERFTKAFGEFKGPHPRSMYHDSFEYNSSWSPDLREEFRKRRGYELLSELPALCGDPRTDERTARVLCDFKETLSDLMIEKSFPVWTRWCRDRGFLTRNQAHGSPGNWLDLYALADIPETEMFGRGTRDPLRSGFDGRFGEGDREPLISKFASSAAHVAGRRLVSAETGTWMAEHFCETLEEMKCLVDLLFVSGVNHVIYHGCCYSPDDAAWPGWLFYASTEMNPRNAIWRDAPLLNDYIARCQSVLQSGQPDNDVLLYWPVHEFWRSTPGLVNPMTVHGRDFLLKQPVGDTARTLWNRGYGFDYVSDRQLSTAATDSNGGIRTPGGTFQTVVVPPAKCLSPSTLEKLLSLASAGATVIFQDRLPEDVPGLSDLEKQKARFKSCLSPLRFEGTDIRKALCGKGQVLVGPLEAALAEAGVRRETLVDHPGMRFIRRSFDGGRHYFLANQGTDMLDGWLPLAAGAVSVAVLDPMSGKSGLVESRPTASGEMEVRMRLQPGHSIILRTLNRAPAAMGTDTVWTWRKPGDEVLKLVSPWKVEFLSGGPTLPAGFETTDLKSWAHRGDAVAEAFAGTAVYRTRFEAPAGDGPWILDLGRVCHSARVRINGRDAGFAFMPPYDVSVPKDLLKAGGNDLEVDVTNLSANRIRDLDRRKVEWRIFHEINFVNIGYKPFDASGWPVLETGLLGPVVLRNSR